MGKESFYFSHDYYARKDPKCLSLIKDFGAKGYGTYWCLVEVMYEQGGKIKKFPALYSGLAFEFQLSEEEFTKQIEAMLHKYELLLEDASHIWSDSVLKRMNIREQKRSKKVEAGKLGGIKSGESRRCEAKRSNASSNTKQTKQSKEKKRKENTSFILNNVTNSSSYNLEKEDVNNSKSEQKKFNQFPVSENFNGLPELKIGCVVQLVKVTKKIELSNSDVLGLWNVFKTKTLTGKKFYQDADAVYDHFINWSKDQKFENGKGNKNNSGRIIENVSTGGFSEGRKR